MIPHRRLGKNGPLVHPVGLGAMSFSNFYGPTNEAEAHATLDACMAAGVNHIDTSNVYGMGVSEEAIGSWLAQDPARKEFVSIATKGGIARRPETNEKYFDNSATYFEAELDKSLKRLGVDCVDLYYAHRRDPNTPIEEITDNLAALVRKGKTKSIGFSEIAPSTLRAAHAVHPVAAVQSEYSLWTRSPELGLVQACAELEIALVAFSPVGRSMLTDRPVTQEKLAELPFLGTNPRFIEPNYSANLEIIARFQALAADMGMPTAGLAIAWVLAQGEQVIAIPGTKSLGHLAELLRGAERLLTADEIAEVERVLPVGWAHGDRYNAIQWDGPERYC